mgnify:CR=1 FL=1
MKKKPFRLRKGHVLVLKQVDKDMKAHGGFVYPSSGEVRAPDWDGGKEVCGGGLHGFLWGAGDGSLANYDPSNKWLVIDCLAEPIVFGGKCKFESGSVVFCGDFDSSVAFVADYAPSGLKDVIGGQATASGNYGKATSSGDGGQATASGNYGKATSSGYGGQATTSGYGGQATASGVNGQATASGDYGKATASGYGGQATTSGYGGQARAKTKGLICVTWWDRKNEMWKMTCANVDGVTIKEMVFYECDDSGNLMERGGE